MKQPSNAVSHSVIAPTRLRGLTTKEVQEKQAHHGTNQFTRETPQGWKIFFRQFMNALSVILLLAAGLSAFMGEYSDGAVILGIVLLNAVLSFIQEYRSEKAVKNLEKFIEKTCLVVRNGRHITVNARDLVPGDAILLKAGDVVPADVKVLQASDLSVNEAQLTGESLPVVKDTRQGSNLLYAGSEIEGGHCQGAVVATGSQSRLGKIAEISKETKKVTPYQKSLAQFSAWLLRLVGATAVLLLTVKAFTLGEGGSFTEVILFSIALAMTTVPEALPMITTINLSYGALKLAKQKVVVKRLAALEDLGRIHILCTDKTGTLTQDRLSVSQVVSENKALFQTLAYVSMEEYERAGHSRLSAFDSALLDYIPQKIKETAGNWERLHTVPFYPALRRRRFVVRDPQTGIEYFVVVGAPETLLTLSLSAHKDVYKHQIIAAGEKGARQLGIACKQITYTPDFSVEACEKDLCFLGFANLLDPIRDTAKASVAQAAELGIAVKILSGDSVQVVAHVGREIGLLCKGDTVCTGEQMEGLSEAQLAEMAKKHNLFARVTPEQKYKLIKALKQENIVGYQGDGINDAPSLKLADVSIAVHSATDVAKESADIVLLEDNLETVVKGIRYGRSIFVNINKYIQHALIGNLGNFFSLVFFYLVFAADIPMLAIQLLVGNLIQDLPLMAVFSDRVDAQQVASPPVGDQMKAVLRRSMGLGAFTAVYYLLFFLLVGTQATPATQATLFLFYNFTQLLIILSIRSEGRFFWQGTRISGLLLGAIALFMGLSVALVYLPVTAAVMGFASLSFSQFAMLTAAAAGFLFLLDIVKVFSHRWKHRRKRIRA